MKWKMRLLLILTLLSMSVLPLAGAYFFLKGGIFSKMEVLRPEAVTQVVKEYQTDLKKLSRLDPESEAEYRARFEDLQGLKLLFENQGLLHESLSRASLKYFGVAFGTFFVLAWIIGLGLSRLISRQYDQTYEEMERQKERSSYLKKMGEWQKVAKRLAHEIKRPLAPIEIWMSNLLQMANLGSRDEIKEGINEMNQVFKEESARLRLMLNEFSRVAKLPDPHQEPVDLAAFIDEFVESYAPTWPETKIWGLVSAPEKVMVFADKGLLRQSFVNLIDNAVEANEGATVEIRFEVETTGSRVLIRVINSGKAISEDLAQQIFEPYFSTKQGEGNMGLGLTIVRFTLVEQGGDIRCLPFKDGAGFELELPPMGVVNES